MWYKAKQPSLILTIAIFTKIAAYHSKEDPLLHIPLFIYIENSNKTILNNSVCGNNKHLPTLLSSKWLLSKLLTANC